MTRDELSSPITEDTIIGECLTKPEETIFTLIENGLAPEWFCQSEATTAISLVLEMYLEQEPINPLTLIEKAEHKKKKLTHDYANRCVDLTPSFNLPQLIRKLKEFHMRREMLTNSAELKHTSSVMEVEPEESIGKTICKLADLTATHSKLTNDQIKEMILKRYHAAASGGCSGIPTPWEHVNKQLGGLVAKQVTIFAGRGGIGKSQASATLVRYLGEQGIPVGYLPFEDGVERTWARLASIEGKYSSYRMDCGASEAEVGMSAQYLEAVMKYPIYMEDRPMTAEQVMAWAIHQKVRNGMKVLIIDAFKDLVRRSRDTAEDDQMSQVLSQTAKRLDIPIWISHHVRKSDMAGKRIEKLTSDDIRGSGNITNDARQVIIAQNWTDDGGVQRYSFDICKNNNGPSGGSIPMIPNHAHNYWAEDIQAIEQAKVGAKAQ